jgi:hypothetical protein
MEPFAQKNAEVIRQSEGNTSRVVDPKIEGQAIQSSTQLKYLISWTSPGGTFTGYKITLYQNPNLDTEVNTWTPMSGFPVDISGPDKSEYEWIAPVETNLVFAKIETLATGLTPLGYIIIEVVDK